MFLDYCFMYMNVLPACIYVCAWCVCRLEEDIGSPRTGVTLGCELPCGYWESNLGLEEQVLLTTEPALICNFILFVWFFETGLLCSFGDQADLELTEIHLPQPPEYWD